MNKRCYGVVLVVIRCGSKRCYGIAVCLRLVVAGVQGGSTPGPAPTWCARWEHSRPRPLPVEDPIPSTGWGRGLECKVGALQAPPPPSRGSHPLDWVEAGPGVQSVDCFASLD